MKKVLGLIMVLFTFFICSFEVNAEGNKYLTKDWNMRQGYTFYDAINWTNIEEVEDGYITATLDSYGYGVLRKISKDGSKIIWENYNEYGLFFGDIQIYKEHIYVLSFDYDYGVYLIEYDLNGNYVNELSIDERTNNEYVWGGETFLHDNMLYIVYKSRYTYVDSDTAYGPEYICWVNLDTMKIISGNDYEDFSPKELDKITGGMTDLISETLNSVYTEKGYSTHFYQQLIRDNYKYYIGTLVNDDESRGLIVKTDLNNKVIWASKSEEKNLKYYDAAYIGNGYIVVSSYNESKEARYPQGVNSELRVYNTEGKIVEVHDINTDLGIDNGDVLTVKEYGDTVIAEVIGWQEEAYISYVVKYHINPFDIEKDIKGEGNIEVNKNAKPGEEVTFTVSPGEGYTLKSVTIIDEYGNVIIAKDNKFIMPEGNVTIKAEFVAKIIENPVTGIKSYIIIGMIIALLMVLIYTLTRRYNTFNRIK